ncbi:MAG: hypothetical protein MK096_15070 [Oleiphilaceae bacterium]|nr:hypothetical protein [Oleiphilaceae bacterium]
MRFLSIFLLLVLSFRPVVASTPISKWSDWMTIKTISLHPDWVVSVEFESNEDGYVFPYCETSIARWRSSSDEIFINNIVGSVIAVKAAKQQVRLWVSTCENGYVLVNQTQFK